MRIERALRATGGSALLAAILYAFLPGLGYGLNILLNPNHSASVWYAVAILWLGYEFKAGTAPAAALPRLKAMEEDLRKHGAKVTYTRLTEEELLANVPQHMQPSSQWRSAMHVKKLDGSPMVVCTLVNDPDLFSNAAYAYIVPGGPTHIFVHSDLDDFYLLTGVARFQFLHELGHCTSVGRFPHEMNAHVMPTTVVAFGLALLFLGAPLLGVVGFVASLLVFALIFEWLSKRSLATERSADVFACAAIDAADAKLVLLQLDRHPYSFRDARFSAAQNLTRRERIADLLRAKIDCTWDFRDWERLQEVEGLPPAFLFLGVVLSCGIFCFGLVCGYSMPVLTLWRVIATLVVAAMVAYVSMHRAQVAHVLSDPTLIMKTKLNRGAVAEYSSREKKG